MPHMDDSDLEEFEDDAEVLKDTLQLPKRSDQSLNETHRTIFSASPLTEKSVTRKSRSIWSYLPWWKDDSKEQSNPPGWPNDTPQEVLEARPYRHVSIGAEQQYIFGDNFVKTSRYEWFTFVPLFLGMEFNLSFKISNCYFLVIAIMQLIPAITNTYGIPIMFAPLSIIVVIDMIFAINEDVTRHRADAAANATPARRLNRDDENWRLCQWWELNVGDIVLLRNYETVPADLIALGVHEQHAPVYSGCCYVETKSLDGETNLKVRSQIKPLIGKMRTARHAASLVGEVIMEHPNKIIHQFTGTIKITSARGCKPFVEPVGHENLLLRGTVVRNTKWVFGLVINTGHDTKVMMAMTKRVDKCSQLTDRITTEIKGIAILLVICCFVGALGGTIFNTIYNRNGEFWYLDKDLRTTKSLVKLFVVQFFSLFLLLYGFIPISLYVTQNFVRFFQSMFMMQDLDMYHEETDTPARVRTMNLNEDLGQISHIFSDKTGTLTENVMDFRKCVIAGKPYGLGTTEISDAAQKAAGKVQSQLEKEVDYKSKQLRAPHVNFYDPKIFADMHDEKKTEQGKSIREFFRVLALCHTVIPEIYSSIVNTPLNPSSKMVNGGANKSQVGNVKVSSAGLSSPGAQGGGSKEPPPEIILSASSPDEEALVLGAKYFGFEFFDRVDTMAKLRIYDDVTQETANISRFSPSGVENYVVMHIFAFDSTRKRMSVIIQRPDGRISLLCKGADNTVIPLLKPPQSGLDNRIQDDTFSLMEIHANEGLRTLVVASKDIPQDVYDEWNVQYTSAQNDVAERKLKNAGKPNLIDKLAADIETGLSLLGVTAIEDRLQKGVGDTIEKLIRAGITVWVITGDKEETAINIGVACRLVWPESRMERIIINTKRYKTVDEIYNKLLKEFYKTCSEIASARELGAWVKPRVLIIDGPAFALMDDSLEPPPIADKHVTVHDNAGFDTNEKSAASNHTVASDDNDSTNVSNEGGGGTDQESAPTWVSGEDGAGLPTRREILLELATVCQAVVGCRMSPDQKRQLVMLVKDTLPGARTLSIGDGANDVPMIQAAHVGVGISGQEGLQAVNASDYAFAQFRFLQKLLLCHGRYNYWRMSLVTTYLFYKSIVWGVPLATYCFFNMWSGQFFYDYIVSNLWALIFTSIPIILFGIYDMDVRQETCLKYPWLYRTGLSDNFLRASVFWGWVLQGFFEGIWITIVVMYTFHGGSGEDVGATPSNLMYGNTCFTIVTIAVNVKMLFIQHRWHWLEIIVLLLSTILMWLTGILINRTEVLLSFDWDFFGTWDILMHSRPYWATTVLAVLGIVIRDIAWRGYHRWWQPKLHHILLEMEVAGKDSVKLPESLEASYGVENVVAGDAQERLEMARGLSYRRGEDSMDSISMGLTTVTSHESGAPSTPRGSILRRFPHRPESARRSYSRLGMNALLHPTILRPDFDGYSPRSATQHSQSFIYRPEHTGEFNHLEQISERTGTPSLCTFSEDETSAALQARHILSGSPLVSSDSRPQAGRVDQRRPSLPSRLHSDPSIRPS